MDEENQMLEENVAHMEEEGNISSKEIRRRKKQLYRDIRNQMEFYFSDANVTKDRFLGKLIMEDPCIDISIFMRFNKIRSLTTSIKDIANALKGSELLSVTEDGTKVFRKTPVTPKENTDDCTIYVEQLPPDATHDWLKEVFSAYGKVAYVSIPKFKSNSKIKGFGFVEFETPEEANKTLEAFGAMGCRLPSQLAPEKLCSIATFEPDDGKPKQPHSEDVKRESNEEDIEQTEEKSTKKKKKKKKSEQTVAESSEAVDTEDSVPQKVQKRKKTEESDVGDSEVQDDTSSPRKKKRKKNDNDEEEEVEVKEEDEECGTEKKKKQESRNEEAESTEEVEHEKKKKKRTHESTEEPETSEGKEYDAEKHPEKKRKKQNEVGEEFPEAEKVLEERGEEVEGEEEMAEGSIIGKRRRRRKKKHKKEKPDAEVGRLQILSKKEWKRLRNKYLDLQKEKMKCLKRYLYKNRWNRNQFQPRPPQHANGHAKAKVEQGQEETDSTAADKKPRISFTSGVIVYAVLDEPVLDVRKFKAEARRLPEVEYVDVTMGANEAFIRCASATAAENVVASSPWPQTQLLKGEEETGYWDKIFQDRNHKFSNNVRVKQRGRDKILRRAERELGKHIRFDD